MVRASKGHCGAARAVLALALLVVLGLAGCAPRWEIEVRYDGAAVAPLSAATWQEVASALPGEVVDETLPLERLLYTAGVLAGERLEVDGRAWPWSEVAGAAWVAKDGTLHLGGETLRPAALSVTPPPEEAALVGTLLGVAPTVADVLGVPHPAAAVGETLRVDLPAAERVALVYLDGYGYRRHLAWRGSGVTPYLDALPAPQVLRSVYPSVTAVSTATMLTGAPPATSGVPARGVRRPKVQTVLEVVTETGRRAVAVEGDALALAMPGAEVTLSGDRDGNGSTDDNVYANALQAAAAPFDLLWVHWHGIDDAGHTYGPDAPETRAAAQAVDGYLAEVVEALPPRTLVLILADHGMHDVQEDGRAGNHGTLLGEDIYVPLWVFLT